MMDVFFHKFAVGLGVCRTEVGKRSRRARLVKRLGVAMLIRGLRVGCLNGGEFEGKFWLEDTHRVRGSHGAAVRSGCPGRSSVLICPQDHS